MTDLKAGARPSKVVRVETKEYMSPAIALTPVHPYGAAVCNQGGILDGHRGCVNFPIQSLRERYLRIEIEDSTGLAVPAFVQWNDGDLDEWVPFCGKTGKPLRVEGTATVWLYPYRSPNLPLCAGTATRGSVTVTFLGRR